MTPHSSTTDRSWKGPILRNLILGCSIGGIPCAVGLVIFIALDDSVPVTQWIVCYLGYFAVCLLNLPGPQTWSRTTQALTLAAGLHTVAWTSLLNLGIETGPVLICFMCALTAGLFLPRWTILVSLATSSVLTGYVRRVPPDLDIPGALTAAGFAGTTIAGLTFIFALVHQLQSQLDQRVRDLAVIEEEQRQRANAEAVLADVRTELEEARKLEAMGRVAGGVAHEFNNILQVVLGWAEELELANGPEERDAVLRDLKASVQTASHLTRDLLSVASRGLHRTSPVPIADRVQVWVKDWQPKLPERVTTTLEVVSTGLVLINEDAMRHALWNLLENAADPTVEASTIAIAIGPPPEASPFVQITVQDDGKGMDANQLKSAVEPFSSTKGARGTGLGLSIVRGTVQQFGGSFHLASQPGEGTTVAIRIPLSSGKLLAPDQGTSVTG